MYKERASQVGRIMTNPRSKSETLSKTAKTRVQEYTLEKSLGIKKDVWSKYTDKGIEVEEQSIKLFSRVAGIFGLQKNEKQLENDWFTGTPDIINGETVIDIKSSWDGTTFPFFETEIPTKDYEYQLYAYMDLTGARRALLVYCLTDAEEYMIQDEVRREAWRRKVIDNDLQAMQELEQRVYKQMTFGHIPDDLRIKVFELEYDQEKINAMRERVELCREYYAECCNILENKITQ